MIKSIVENGRIAALIIALIIVSGFGALSTLPRTEDPEITNRFATVITHYPGASAERVEALVSEVLENQLRRMEEIKLISSTSRPNISVIQLELKDKIKQTDAIWSRARNILADSQSLLPKATLAPKLDDQIGYASTAILGLSWHHDSPVRLDILNRYAKELQSRLRLLSGTDFVKLYGQPTEEVLITLDSEKLARLKLTPAMVARQLQLADSKIAAGEISNQSFRALIEVKGELDTLQRIGKLPIKATNSADIIRIDDIATIKKQAKSPATSLALINGQQGIMVGAVMLPDVRVDRWQQQVTATVDELTQQFSSNVKINWLFEQNSYTKVRLGDLTINLLQGFVIILVVLMMTLGLRNALIVALALPLTALFTLSGMKIVHLPIHQMSVTGLVVALGIMVDNAIVIVDAISQRRAEGQSRLEAVGNTLKHLWLPLAGSTLTTILAFTPIILMPGASGEFVSGIAISVVFALIGSYAISHTVIAGLAGRFSDCNRRISWLNHGIQFETLSHWYHKLLAKSLARPLITSIIVGLIPITGFIAAGKLTEQFFPPSDRDMFQIEMYLAPQSSIDHTYSITQKVDKYLRANHNINQLDWMVGGNVPSFYYNLLQRQQGSANYAQAMVKVKDFNTANQLIPLLQQELNNTFPQAQILVRKLEQGPPFNAPIEFRVYGQNLDILNEIGEQLRQQLYKSEHVLHTRTTLSSGSAKIWIEANEDAALMLGLNLTSIAEQIAMATTGVLGGTLLEETEILPVRLRLDETFLQHPQKLDDLNLITASGERVPFSSVAEQKMTVSRGAIPRRDGKRINVVEAYLATGVLPASVLEKVQADINAIELPDGYRIELGGESAKRNEAVSKLLSSVAVVLTLLIATIVLSFNSFRLTAIILFSALQSVGLGLLAVFIFNYPFGFNVIIGLLGLMGLAINAAIVILAELESDATARQGENEVIITLVGTCTRHISSTTITTIGGFLPLILAGGGFWPPFAVAIAGGTLLTTLISLLWVPAMYRLLMCKN
ncbi:MAG: efflux RND transporter permease subunit [Parashewanella sp.]